MQIVRQNLDSRAYHVIRVLLGPMRDETRKLITLDACIALEGVRDARFLKQQVEYTRIFQIGIGVAVS